MTENETNASAVDKKNKGLIHTSIIKTEVNFARLPFFALSRKGLKNKTKTEYSNVVERDGKKLEVFWKVTANAEYGYPTAFDKKVSKAIEYIVNESGIPIENPVKFSLYQVAELTGLKASKKGHYSGAVYKSIRDSLVRIVGAMVESRGTFYAKGTKRWINDVFHLYDRIVFKGEELPSGEIADTNYLFLSSWYLESINSFYIKPLDFNYYRSLRSSLAGRLYEFLSIQFYGSNGKPYKIDYHKLCQLMPVEPQKYFSLSKQVFSNAHEELKRTKFLSHVSWEDKGRRKWIITYYPGSRAKKELENNRIHEQLELELQCLDDITAEADETDKSSPENYATAKLTQRGITGSTAKKLANFYSAEQIQKQIEIFDWLVSKKSPLVAKNPAGFLRKSIEENYEPPAEYFHRQERRLLELKKEQERIDKEAEQARLDEIQEQVDEYRDNLTDHEREQLRKEALELIENDKEIKKEFVTEILICAKEAEIVRKRLGLDSSD